MLRPPKGFAVKNEDGLEQAIAVQKSAVEDRNDGAFFGHELAIEEDKHTRF